MHVVKYVTNMVDFLKVAITNIINCAEISPLNYKI